LPSSAQSAHDAVAADHGSLDHSARHPNRRPERSRRCEEKHPVDGIAGIEKQIACTISDWLQVRTQQLEIRRGHDANKTIGMLTAAIAPSVATGRSAIGSQPPNASSLSGLRPVIAAL